MTTFPEKTNATLTENDPETDDTLGLVIGLLVMFLVALMGVVIVIICLARVIVRKRKATTRSLQLEALTRWALIGLDKLCRHNFEAKI